MANFNEAVQITLAHEGGFFENIETGEVVNHGITAKFLAAHGLPHSIDDVRALSIFNAAVLYRTYFWTPMCVGALTDQTLAGKVFDVGVNEGEEWAEEELQNAVNDITGVGHIAVDGHIGPQTIAAANALDPVALLASFRARAAARYRQVASANPNLAEDLKGWLARLAA
jgi:lysozyme family protein